MLTEQHKQILTENIKQTILELIRKKPLFLAAQLEQMDKKAFADVCKELRKYAEELERRSAM